MNIISIITTILTIINVGLSYWLYKTYYNTIISLENEIESHKDTINFYADLLTEKDEEIDSQADLIEVYSTLIDKYNEKVEALKNE